MVEIQVKDGELFVKSEYDKNIVSFMRSRPKRFWNTVTRQWVIPESDLPLLLQVLVDYEYNVTYNNTNEQNSEILNNIPDWYEFKTNPFQHQIEGVNYGLQHPKYLLADEPGLGKALSLDTKVYTPDGYKLMKDIQVGDYVFNKEGKPVKVVATYDNKNVNMCKITFSDGVSIKCCEDHLWEIYVRRKKKVVDTKWFFGTDHFGNSRNECKTPHGYYKYYIDKCNPVNFNPVDVPIDPYVLGCILGDGNISQHYIRICIPDSEIYDNIVKRLPNGYILSKPKSLSDSYEYLITKDNRDSSSENIILTSLKKLGLLGTTSHTKFIPDVYKYNSIDVRFDLIRGLIDTDGYSAKKSNLLQYTTVSDRLIEDVIFIVESLGGIVGYSKKDAKYDNIVTGVSHNITIKCDNPEQFCSLTRKKNRLCARKNKPKRKIVSVEYIGTDDAKCITVDDPDGLYLIEHFVVTHNTKQMLDLSQIYKKEHNIKHTLIIACVNSLKYNWQAEVLKHTNDKGYILGTRYRKSGTEYIGSNEDRLEDINSIGKGGPIDDYYYIITNIETLRYSKSIKVPLKTKKNGVQRFKKQTLFPIVEAIQKQIADGNINMIIADEVHACKDSASLQGKALLALDCDYKVALTGTPVMNQPIDIYTTLNWLGFEKHSAFAFKKHYCIMGGFGQHQIVGYKNLPELQSILDKCMLRRLKQDVLDLPEKIYINDYVEMTKDQIKLYDDVRNNIIENIDKIKLSPNPLVQLIRLRQVTGNPNLLSSSITANPKFDRMLEIVEEVVANNGKVLVFSNWTNVIEPAYELLKSKKYDPAMYTGKNKDIREKEKDRFMTDEKCKVFLGTMDAMGTGLTLTAANTVVFLDDPWNRAKKDQCEDRVHRIGTKESPNIITIMCKGTIDERINELVCKKGKMSDVLIDKEEDLMRNPKIVNYLLSID